VKLKEDRVNPQVAYLGLDSKALAKVKEIQDQKDKIEEYVTNRHFKSHKVDQVDIVDKHNTVLLSRERVDFEIGEV
jgi:hypothetical protein